MFLVAYFVFNLANAEATVPRSGPENLPDYSIAARVALSTSLGFMILFPTVLVHELGHCAAAKMVGGQVDRILLWPLGGIAFCAHGGTALGDLFIAVAGPATHAPQWAFWWAVHREVSRHDMPVLEQACLGAMSMQISLACFNLLLPVFPLDGSKVVVASMQIFGAPARHAAAVVCLLSLFALGVMLASMFGGFA